MKAFTRWLVLAMLSGATMLCAQTNFSGSDNFSSGLGNWTAGATNNGTLGIYDNALNFTDSAHATSTYFASQDWSLNAGSSTADWSVQVDFTLPTTSQLTLAGGEFISWNLYVRDGSTLTTATNNWFRAFLQRTYSGTNMVEVEMMTNGVTDVYGGDRVRIFEPPLSSVWMVD